MKTFYLILLVFCATFTRVYGQAGEKIPVPILKDKKNIDDLIEIILKQKKRGSEAETKFQTDSSLVVYMLKFKDYFSFGVAEKSNAVMNGIINKFFFIRLILAILTIKRTTFSFGPKTNFMIF